MAMDSNPSQITQDSYYTNKKELEQIEKEELNSIIFKSELKWTEDGEKHSKYFRDLDSIQNLGTGKTTGSDGLLFIKHYTIVILS